MKKQAKWLNHEILSNVLYFCVGGPGLERGMQGEPAEFNVWTREAGPGSLAISVEGPSKV